MGELTSVQWMHSCYDRTDERAILTVKEKVVKIDEETKQILDTKTNLRQFFNPARRVWITKPEFRTHRYKKESELLSRCEVYKVEDRLLAEFLKTQLGFPKYQRILTRELCNSPYVYGTDISMEALVRYKYETNALHDVAPIKIGSLDIESSVIHDDHRTNLITVICDKKVYLGALNEFMWKTVNGKKVRATAVDIRTKAEAMIGDYIKKYDFELHIECFDQEMDLYKWIFGHIQEEEPDYMFIWNLGYDVPQMISRITANGLDPKDFFCDPKIPKQKQYLRYYDDKRQVSHIVEKWNWLHATSMTQWLDAMALYGQVRRQKPKESSYKLGDVMTKMIKATKIDFGDRGHYEMQTEDFVTYAVYNIFDAMLVQIGTWESQDYNSLYMLTEHSTLMDFSKQTVMLGNDYHHELLADGRVFATTGKDITGPYDHMLTKVGGAVLDARNVTDMGAKCVVERPDRVTAVLLYCADDDYSSLYPSWKIAAAIAKENKLATLVSIENMPPAAVEALCSTLSDPKENAVWIGNEYFGLKNYTQMAEHVQKELIARGLR